jgi:hypothetical protein
VRNPVATPASIILGILLLGAVAMVVITFIGAGKAEYVLEQNRSTYIWGTAFLRFLDSFFAFQCAGALIAYSLFLSVPSFFERKSLFRYLSAILVSLVVLTVLYTAGSEVIGPSIRTGLREARNLGLFSESLFLSARQKKANGDSVTALEYLDHSITIDGQNPKKIEERATLYNGLTAAQRDLYLERTTGENQRDRFDPAAVLEDARNALTRRDYGRAYDRASLILSLDPANVEAMRIAGIAGDKSYASAAERERAEEHTLFVKKKAGVDALQAGTTADIIRAYFIFVDLHRRYPLDKPAAEYLEQARRSLSDRAFFIAEAELALSFRDLADRNIIFFNSVTDDERELVSIDGMIALGGEQYFRNIEVAGLGPGGRVRYHYLAPYGKLVRRVTLTTNGLEQRHTIRYFITMHGIGRLDPALRTGVRILAGTPPLDRDRGLPLDVDPEVLHSYTITPADIEGLSLGELAALLPPLQRKPLFSGHAHMDELIIREIILHVIRPLLLLILTLFCFCIGLTQNARYLSAVPKTVYLWVIIIPFAMIAVMNIVLFLHRMSTVFLYYALGAVVGTIVITLLHVFFLGLALLRFGGKISASLRR